MKKEDQLSLEIISKVVIQLKTSQIDTIKKVNEKLENLKIEGVKNMMEIREKYDKEIFILKENLNEMKFDQLEKEKIQAKEIIEIKSKHDKNIFELREDMLKLLKKYESKFQTQDEEIDMIKRKCELADCKICNFQSFKVHFFNCEECASCICSECMFVCKHCKIAKCQDCLKKCNYCASLLCKDCAKKCDSCSQNNCAECYDKCGYCILLECKACLKDCRNCDKIFCVKCAAKCEKCGDSVSCITCLQKEGNNERCICRRLFCSNCEDDCKECTMPICWDVNSRIFQGFQSRSANTIPVRCLVKFCIINKGIDTSHLGITCDTEFKDPEKATENFWSLCLNSGEKFSTSDYKKKGIPWTKYAIPVKANDIVFLRFFDGEVKFFINRKEYPTAFNLDKSLRYFIYCLTHDDSSKIEIKSLKVYK